MRKTNGICIATFFLLLLCATATSAKVYIDINAPGSNQVPILVPDFKNQGSTPVPGNLEHSMARIIADDLSFSGFFRVLDPSSLDDSYLEGLTRDKIRWDILSIIGAETIVTGGFQDTGSGELVTELRLFDAVQGRFITGKKYQGKNADYPLISHRFANEIFMKLTGEQGIFTTKIAYVNSNGSNKELAIMDYDGRNRKQVSWYDSITISPAWSPDGRQLAFTSYKDGNPDLYIKNIYSGKTKKISQKQGINISPAWSPDGKKIALTLSLNNGNSEIYTITVKNQQLKRLTRNWAIDVSPTWSPDGKYIAFVSSRSGTPQIYILNLTRGKIRRLTYEGNENTTPAWSPRGNFIAYAGRVGGKFNILIITPDGGFSQQLTFSSGNSEEPAWSPDGRYLSFSSDRTGRKEIYIMRYDGTGLKKITDGKGDKSDPAWSPF